jgi:hypothetical protein
LSSTFRLEIPMLSAIADIEIVSFFEMSSIILY